MFNFEKEIARNIVLAQIASDAGKNIFELNIQRNNKAEYGYYIKDKYIFNVIKLINNSRGQSGFHYYCIRDIDQNGHISNIIYFSFRGSDGKRYQVSFHSFNGGEIKRLALKSAGRACHWDKKSSRQACQILINDYNL